MRAAGTSRSRCLGMGTHFWRRLEAALGPGSNRASRNSCHNGNSCDSRSRKWLSPSDPWTPYAAPDALRGFRELPLLPARHSPSFRDCPLHRAFPVNLRKAGLSVSPILFTDAARNAAPHPPRCRSMAKSAGRSLPISPFRRIVTDLMSFSQQVPSVTADRRMDLRPLIAARNASPAKPGWCVLFSKAFALLGRDYPELRRTYIKFPWPRLYEHPHSIVALNVERRHADETVVLYCLISRPETRSIAAMAEIVRHHKEAPIESLRSYQRSSAVAKIPWPVRPWFWWWSLNLFGRRRSHNFGTFSISSVAAQGAA